MFQMDNLNPAMRYFFGEEENNEWVEFRLTNDEEMQKIRKVLGLKNKQKHVPNPITKRMDTVSDVGFDDEKAIQFNDALICYQIADWNLVEPSGKEIPCTDENKKKLMYGSPVFAKWANKCLEKMQGDLDAIEEEEEKN